MTNIPYNTDPTNATRNRQIVEQKLGWTLQTLRNPRIRRSERRCLLLLAGSILRDYLSRQHREAAA